MINVIEDALSMQNKAYIYKNKQIVVLSVVDGVGLDGEYVNFYLDDGKCIECHISNLRMKIAEFKPIGHQVVVVANKALESVSTFQPTIIAELRDTLLQSIREVKADKGKISQAKAINESVNALVNLAKTEIEFRKLISNTETR